MHADSSTQNLSVYSYSRIYAPAVSRTSLLQIKKRNRDPNRVRTGYLTPLPGGQNAAQFVNEHGDPDSGGSDDEDSYGSQDRRSDGGYHGRD